MQKYTTLPRCLQSGGVDASYQPADLGKLELTDFTENHIVQDISDTFDILKQF